MAALHQVGAAAPGPVTPAESDDARELGGCAGTKGQGTGISPDCAHSEEQRKQLATLKARAAICGCTLHELAGGGYLLCRWNLSRELPCLQAVGDLLRQIGGHHG